MHVKHTIPNCTYNRLPEDEPSVWKHVEDIINISLVNLDFVGLYCIILLQCNVQKRKKIINTFCKNRIPWEYEVIVFMVLLFMALLFMALLFVALLFMALLFMALLFMALLFITEG